MIPISPLIEKGQKALMQWHLRGIKSRDFTIIASNCTGTLPYRFLDMEYLTPTANLFFHAPCYLKFVTRLDHYLAQPLRFISASRYANGRQVHAEHGLYPIGILDDIEIHFMHYSDASDAAEKWERRKKRINRNNLVYAFTDRDGCTPEIMQAFDRLPGRKLMLTAKPAPWISCAVTVPHWYGQSEIGDAYTQYNTLRHVNYRKFIDGDADTRNVYGRSAATVPVSTK